MLGALSVERSVVLIAAVDVRGAPGLAGSTIGEAFRPGAWRVIALDTALRPERPMDLSRHAGAAAGDLLWNLEAARVLTPRDRVLVVATRQGLAELLGRRRTPSRDV